MTPDSAYELRESARRALDGFAALPETQRSALIQSAFAGTSRTQIAAMTRKMDSTTAWVVCRTTLEAFRSACKP